MPDPAFVLQREIRAPVAAAGFLAGELGGGYQFGGQRQIAQILGRELMGLEPDPAMV